MIMVSRGNPVPSNRTAYAVAPATLNMLPANLVEATCDNGWAACHGKEEGGRFQETDMPAPEGGEIFKPTSMPILLYVAVAVMPVIC